MLETDVDPESGFRLEPDQYMIFGTDDDTNIRR